MEQYKVNHPSWVQRLSLGDKEPVSNRKTTEAQETRQAQRQGTTTRTAAPGGDRSGTPADTKKSGSHTHVGRSRSQGLHGLVTEKDRCVGPREEQEADKHRKPQDKEGEEERQGRGD